VSASKYWKCQRCRRMGACVIEDKACGQDIALATQGPRMCPWDGTLGDWVEVRGARDGWRYLHAGEAKPRGYQWLDDCGRWQDGPDHMIGDRVGTKHEYNLKGQLQYRVRST
jgi:hypothetical protein